MGLIGNYLNKQAGKFIKQDDKQEVGIGGYTAFVHISQTLTRTADIPTSPLENGSHANDHIILQPVKIDFSGYVPEVILKPAESLQLQRELNNKAPIATLSKYGGDFTRQQLQRINSLYTSVLDISDKVDSLINDGQNMLDFLNPNSKEKEESGPLAEKFISDMLLLYESKTPFNVEIGSEIFENMFMTSWATDWNIESNKGIKYSMSLQQIEFAKEIYEQVVVKPAPAVSSQVEDKKSKGVNKPKELVSNLSHMKAGTFFK